MKKVMLVFGTRPEAIKMAPLVKALEADTEHFRTVVTVTGQHRELLDSVLQLFDVHPQYDLHIMKPNQDLFDITSRILLGMRDVLEKECPDLVLVHGDTTTAMATAQAAFNKQIPVGHIEAGLRTFNIYSPFPEEMNRRQITCLSTYHFAPTALNKANLLKEGIPEDHIFVTGNTVIDAMRMTLDRMGISANSSSDRRMVLITGHRRENFGEGFDHIMHAIKQLAEKYADVDFVYPVHPNPQVRKAIKDVFGISDISACSIPNLRFIEPVDYIGFMPLLARSTIVLTDSGGIQEEAPGLGKPVLVMRDTTERPEAVEAGTVKLVGTDTDCIVASVSELLDDPVAYAAMSKAVNPYGHGDACQHIVTALRHIEVV